jgi:hypothetical protein
MVSRAHAQRAMHFIGQISDGNDSHDVYPKFSASMIAFYTI